MVWGHICMWKFMCTGHKKMSGGSPCFSPSLRPDFPWHVYNASWPMGFSKFYSPISIFSLQVGVCWDYKLPALQPSFYMGFGYPDSGCQSWKITTLPNETSPQSLSSALNFKLHLLLLYFYYLFCECMHMYICTMTYGDSRKITRGSLLSPTMGIPGLNLRQTQVWQPELSHLTSSSLKTQECKTVME